MQIKLSPQRLDATLVASVVGDIIILNNQPFDFSQLPEGASLPTEAIDSNWFERPGVVERVNGELYVTLVLPVGPSPSQAVAFPAPIHVTEDGDIPMPFDPEPEVIDGVAA